jgi:TonB family protein
VKKPMTSIQKVFLIAWMLFLVVVPAAAVGGSTSPASPNSDQEGGAAPDPSLSAPPEGAFTPPVLKEYIKADYPKEALDAGLEADVETEIDIDETGLVVGVKIIKPAGHGFDEAAEDAIYRFVFSPAAKGGVPIPSRVTYRYRFFIEKVQETPTPEAEAPPPVANLAGKVTDMDGNKVPGATLLITVPGMSEVLTLTADAEGAFSAADLTPRSYQVEVAAAGYKPFSVEEKLEDGETREVVYRVEPEDSEYESVIRARKPPREVTRREVTRREITRIPGTGGDALRSIQNLPGMARAPLMSGALIVRGSAPGDSKYFFDSMPIPMLYHFGGLTSVINSDLLESIDFFPGNYSVRYGGATGGIVEVYPKAPETDRIHAYIDADIMDAGLLVEGPIGKKWSMAISGRRSYLDALFKAVMPKNMMTFTVAPRYYDYQVIADYHPSKKNNLRLFLFGSDDRFEVILGKDFVANPVFTGGGQFKIYFHQFQARWTYNLGGGFTNVLNAGVGFQRGDSGAGDLFKFESDYLPFYLRDEIAYDKNRNIAYRIGLDTEISWNKWTVRAPASGFGLEGQPMDPLSANEEMAETSGSGVYVRPGVYTEFEIRPVKKLKLITGLRVDYYDLVEEAALDPRFVVRYQLFEKTVLKGGIGMFHQAPTGDLVDEQFGNPDLSLINAMHYTIGAEQSLFRNVELSLEGFFKRMRNLISSDPVTRYNNQGTGKVWGLEFLLKHNDNGRFFGWISYTLMRSERIDHPGDRKRLFDYDQTHILTIVASAVIGRGWEAGLRFRLVSGNPQTPVSGSMFDADSDIYWPIYGAVNSTRMPMFHQLDIRVDKKWTFKYLKFSIYLDVQNIYNHKNPEFYSYNFDYSQKQYFNGLPVLPILGFRLEY